MKLKGQYTLLESLPSKGVPIYASTLSLIREFQTALKAIITMPLPVFLSLLGMKEKSIALIKANHPHPHPMQL